MYIWQGHQNYQSPTNCSLKSEKSDFPQKSLTLSVRLSKKVLSPRLSEVWWSSNFVKDLEVEFPSKKSDTFGETIQKISKSQAG